MAAAGDLTLSLGDFETGSDGFDDTRAERLAYRVRNFWGICVAADGAAVTVR